MRVQSGSLAEWFPVKENKIPEPAFNDDSFLAALQELVKAGEKIQREGSHFQSGPWQGMNVFHFAAYHGFYRSLTWLRSKAPRFQPFHLVKNPSNSNLEGSNVYECALINPELDDETAYLTFKALAPKSRDLLSPSENKILPDWTLIHYAIQRGFVETTRWMLSQTQKFKPLRLVSMKASEAKECAWEIFFTSPFAKDETCLRFMKLFSEECDPKFRLPTKFASTVFDGAHPIHLAIAYKMPKTLLWLIEKNKNFNLADEITSENESFHAQSAATLIFNAHEIFDGSVNDDERRMLWRTLLNSATEKKQFLFYELRKAMRKSLSSNDNPEFFFSLILETNKLAHPAWSITLGNIYQDMQDVSTREHLRTQIHIFMNEIALTYAALKQRASISLEEAIQLIEADTCTSQKKASIKKSSDFPEPAKLELLRRLSAPFDCGEWRSVMLYSELALLENIRYGTQTLTLLEFRNALVKTLRRYGISPISSDVHVIRILIEKPFNAEEAQQDLINYFKGTIKPIEKSKSEKEDKIVESTSPSENAPAARQQNRKKTVVDKILSDPEKIQKEWDKRNAWLARGAPLAEKKRPLKSAELEAKPLRIRVRIKNGSTSLREIRAESSSESISPPEKTLPPRVSPPAQKKPAKTKTPEARSPSPLKEFPMNNSWIITKLDNLRSALHSCYVMKNAFEDLEGKTLANLREACDRQVKSDPRIGRRFQEGSAEGSLHRHIIFLSQRYSLMKASAQVGYVFLRDAQKNPAALDPINYRACQVIRNSLRHPKDPNNSPDPQKLFLVTREFIVKLTPFLEEYQKEKQRLTEYFTAPIYLDPTPLEANPDRTPPCLDSIIECLKNNFELIAAIEKICLDIRQNPVYFEHLSYLHNAVKALIMILGQALRDLKASHRPIYDAIFKHISQNPNLLARNSEGNLFTQYEDLLNLISHHFENEGLDQYSYFEDIPLSVLNRTLVETQKISDTILEFLQSPLNSNNLNPSTLFATRKKLSADSPPFTPTRTPNPLAPKLNKTTGTKKK